METSYPQIKMFYEELGSDRIRALGYKEKALINEVATRHQESIIAREMQQSFPIGDCLYSSGEIKAIMNSVFEKFGIVKKGKITELGTLYHVQMKLTKPTVSIGKRATLYKVISHQSPT